MEKDAALGSCTTGVEHAENVDAKYTAEILVDQLERGFDDRYASVLKKQRALIQTKKPKENTHGDDTANGDIRFGL